MTREHNHYYKDVSGLQTIDVYRVLKLFDVTDPCIQHAVKKLLVAGGRGAGKDISKDIKESIDSLQRWQEMQEEQYPKRFQLSQSVAKQILRSDSLIQGTQEVQEGEQSEHFRCVLEDALVTAATTRNASPAQKLEVLKLYSQKGK